MTEKTLVAAQSIYLVFGGELTRPDEFRFKDPSQIRYVGMYDDKEEALKAWRGVTGQTIDDAHMRFFVVDLANAVAS